ncbi:Fis family transcriptional regulator [Microlunatus elymi]|uniref:Fis family transcriptional regulator n=1 Tax=Microlunatus elymi TaxID=2596828 RepID=A0A516PUM1_9ACTN|nr:Fis family transcriptional regulator [Microlunatus elymi]QDP94877.1 Fis family transcriptional regulator [Microlunatus elymi]
MTQNAHFDDELRAVVIEHLTVSDEAIAREACRWTTGVRDRIVEDNETLAAADLTAFAVEALKLGAYALAVTGQATDARAFEQLLKEVEDKTVRATDRATELTERVVKDASEAVTKATEASRKAFADAEETQRKEFTRAVDVAKKEFAAELHRLIGGDHPELASQLQVLLERFGTGLNERTQDSTNKLIEKAARQFDPSDPTSPMAKHIAAITSEQSKVAEQMDKNHRALAEKVEALVTALKVQEARTTLASVTPIKGNNFEAQIHALMQQIATGLGDEYADTTKTVGLVPRSKKGDGVLNVDGGSAQVVIEVTDSDRKGWVGYFDEAERNRGAQAALGIVRTREQNCDQSIRILGPRRVVMAFDPAEDDAELLRTAVMLLRTTAIAASIRTGSAEIETAEEKIADAIEELVKIDTVKKIAGTIQKNAGKIESECTKINTTIHRLLDDALTALAGAPHSEAAVAAVDATKGVA